MPDLHTDINIHETINSGQIFLWENYGNEWFVIDGHDVIMAKQKPFEIITFSKKPKNFFREDDNYRKILKNITKDKIVKKASKYYSGLRVTRQDPFQCCISFIVSANSNIPNIRMRLQKLCIKFGTKVRFQKESFFYFLHPKCLQMLHCKISKNVNWDIDQNMFWTHLASLLQERLILMS